MTQYDHVHQENEYGVCRICAQRAARARKPKEISLDRRLARIKRLEDALGHLKSFETDYGIICYIDAALADN